MFQIQQKKKFHAIKVLIFHKVSRAIAVMNDVLSQ